MIKDAEKFIDEIEAQINPITFRTCLYLFVKIWEKVYDNIKHPLNFVMNK